MFHFVRLAAGGGGVILHVNDQLRVTGDQNATEADQDIWIVEKIGSNQYTFLSPHDQKFLSVVDGKVKLADIDLSQPARHKWIASTVPASPGTLPPYLDSKDLVFLANAATPDSYLNVDPSNAEALIMEGLENTQSTAVWFLETLNTLMNRKQCRYLQYDEARETVETDIPREGLSPALWFIEKNPGQNKLAIRRLSTGNYLSVVGTDQELTLTDTDHSGPEQVWTAVDASADGNAGDVYLQNEASQTYLQVQPDRGTGTFVGALPAEEERRFAMWQLLDQAVPDARSVHLRYNLPKDINLADLFYIEVQPGQDDTTPTGTYYCAIGYGSSRRGDRQPCGYFGIQRLPNGQKMLIFSGWNKPEFPNDNPTVHWKADSVKVVGFGNEGTGISTRLTPAAWTDTHWQRFCLHAEPYTNTDHPGDLGHKTGTLVSAYADLDRAGWHHMATLFFPYAQGQLFTRGFYSFIEDFKRNGLHSNVEGTRSPWEPRSANFQNICIRSKPAAALLKVKDKATFTAYSPHPFSNMTASGNVSSPTFYMTTGTANDTEYATNLYKRRRPGSTIRANTRPENSFGFIPDLPPETNN